MNKNALRQSMIAAFGGGAFAVACSSAAAAGFQIQEQSASGLGVAYAGQAAAVHDASTVFWNPAGMALLSGRQGVAAGSWIIPDTRYRDSGTSSFAALGDGGQGGEQAIVPALYGTWAIDSRWSVGIGMNAPYGLATEWDSTWAGQFHAVRSEIKTLNFNPTVAYRVNDQFAIGAGVSYQRLEAELTNRAVLSPPFPATLVGTGKVKGDDWGWGWNVGALMSVGPQTRVGVTYRSEIDYQLDGDLTFAGFPAELPSRAIGSDVTLPQTLSVAIAHQWDPGTRVLADFTWTGWDSIQELRVVDRATGGTVSNTTLNFDNSWRVGVGVERSVSRPWLVRFGLAYDTTPVQDAYRTPRLPDENRVWLSLGARYTPEPDGKWWIDFGYTHIWVDEASSELPFAGAPAAEAARGTLRGTYKASVDIVAAQVGFRF
jgi:long-chain fatty acid transport protein